MTNADPLTTVVTALIGLAAVCLGLTAEQSAQAVTAIVALIGVVYAWYMQSQKNTIIEAMTPGTPAASTPSIVASLPVRTWTMSDATKHWLTFDATPANRQYILQQIDNAEAEHQVHYFVYFEGGNYEVEYGLLKGSTGNPAGKV